MVSQYFYYDFFFSWCHLFCWVSPSCSKTPTRQDSSSAIFQSWDDVLGFSSFLGCWACNYWTKSNKKMLWKFIWGLSKHCSFTVCKPLHLKKLIKLLSESLILFHVSEGNKRLYDFFMQCMHISGFICISLTGKACIQRNTVKLSLSTWPKASVPCWLPPDLHSASPAGTLPRWQERGDRSA